MWLWSMASVRLPLVHMPFVHMQRKRKFHAMNGMTFAGLRIDMPNLIKLAPFTDDDLIRVVIETPRNARVKLKYEPDLRVFEYDRALPAGLAYPYDWGFVPSTLGEDGDPLDGMVIHGAATFPGTVFVCRPMGVLRVKQTEGGKTVRNDRYFFSPVALQRAKHAKNARELSSHEQRDLEQFFDASVIDTGKTLEFLGWMNADAAIESLRAGARSWRQAK
jgi:inorganic pyrophosphatase